MWLLSTDRAELHLFSSPQAVPGGYAILSHTWGKKEQTFQDTQELRIRCQGTRKNPLDHSSEKVRNACILAARYGYQWLWDDTCCIDKTNPAALSEDINSMFLYYSLAELCLAHLEDVESNCVPQARDSAFRTARWHSRGWTLQELVAPLFLVFVSQDWKAIGSKHELAQVLHDVTGVRRKVLTREIHHSAVSVAERMAWASKRRTTRVEDEAYCLMGLFDVTMPTIYGEGRQAFQRLQREIMKQSFDTSLFAWGPHLAPARGRRLAPLARSQMYQCFSTVSSRNSLHILASSPRSFAKLPSLPSVRYTPGVDKPFQPYLEWQYPPQGGKISSREKARRQAGPFGRIELPSFSATNFGLKCRFPIIESEGLTVAVLLCDNGSEHLGLLLHPAKTAVQDPSRRKYYIGCCFAWPSNPDIVSFARLVSLGTDLYKLVLNGKPVTASWRDIFVADSPRAVTKDVVLSLSSQLNRIVPAGPPPFRVPHWIISKLMAMGMDPIPLQIASSLPGTPLQMAVLFLNTDAWEGIRLILGTCHKSESRGGRRPSPTSHWAKAAPLTFRNWSSRTDYSHDCSVHHIKKWPGAKKDFVHSDERVIQLSFSPCKLTPGGTLVVSIELKGRVYDAMKDCKTVESPLREKVKFGMDPKFTPGYRPHAAAQNFPDYTPMSIVPYGSAQHYLEFSANYTTLTPMYYM